MVSLLSLTRGSHSHSLSLPPLTNPTTHVTVRHHARQELPTAASEAAPASAAPALGVVDIVHDGAVCVWGGEVSSCFSFQNHKSNQRDQTTYLKAHGAQKQANRHLPGSLQHCATPGRKKRGETTRGVSGEASASGERRLKDTLTPPVAPPPPPISHLKTKKPKTNLAAAPRELRDVVTVRLLLIIARVRHSEEERGVARRERLWLFCFVASPSISSLYSRGVASANGGGEM